MGNGIVDSGRNSHLKQIWAVGRHREPTMAPDPVKTNPVEAKILKEKGLESEIRFRDSVIPEVHSPEVKQLEEKPTTGSLTPPIEPLDRVPPLTVPVWLDPRRYIPLDRYQYESVEMTKAWHRGVYHQSIEWGYSTAVLNHDSIKRNEFKRRLPQIIEEVNRIMLKHVPGFTPPSDPITHPTYISP